MNFIGDIINICLNKKPWYGKNAMADEEMQELSSRLQPTAFELQTSMVSFSYVRTKSASLQESWSDDFLLNDEIFSSVWDQQPRRRPSSSCDRPRLLPFPCRPNPCLALQDPRRRRNQTHHRYRRQSLLPQTPPPTIG
jgi:hypothetical protein